MTDSATTKDDAPLKDAIERMKEMDKGERAISHESLSEIIESLEAARPQTEGLQKRIEKVRLRLRTHHMAPTEMLFYHTYEGHVPDCWVCQSIKDLSELRDAIQPKPQKERAP